MPGRTRRKGSKSSGREQTPRIRPLEALLRRGDRQGYDDAIRTIMDEGPGQHQEGRAFQHGRVDANGEWIEEKFRITRETIMAVAERLGAALIPGADPEEVARILNESAVAVLSPNRIKTPGITDVHPPSGKGLQDLTIRLPEKNGPVEATPEEAGLEKNDPEQSHPAALRQVELMKELRDRVSGAAVLLTMPDLGTRTTVMAESTALQMERITRIIWSSQRKPDREDGDGPRWAAELREMTRMTKRVQTEAQTEEELQDYLERVPGWLELIQDRLGDHTASLGDAGWFRVRIQRGMDGDVTCEPVPDGPPGAMECAWPRCLGTHPLRCSYTGRSWRACQLPDHGAEQTRDKHFAAKHEDLFPWPPEWDEEIRRIEAGEEPATGRTG